MAKKTIVFAPPDSLKKAFEKVEDNTVELYAQIATLGNRQETATKQRKNPINYGGISDGLPHPLSGLFTDLDDAQAIYPSALSLAEQVDDNAWRLTLKLAKDAHVGFEVPVGTAHSTTGQVVNGWVYGIAPDRFGAPTIDGPGPRHARLRNSSTNYALTYSLTDNVNTVFDTVSVGGVKFTTESGGGIEFLAGVGQSDIHHLEFDGMGSGKFAIQCTAANSMFMTDIHDNRFISEEFPFAGGILNLTGAVNLNVHFHDNFATHMKANAANVVVHNAINSVFDVNQFEHTGGIASNMEHSFVSFTGFSFNVSLRDNYLEGTWGCFARAADNTGALIGLELRNLYCYEYDATIQGGGTQSPIILDLRNTSYGVHVRNVTHLNGHALAGGGYLFHDTFHQMDGEGVHNFRMASTGAQANRFVEPLLTGKNHSGTVVSVFNPNESGRRSGRGLFPTNPNQGIGNPSNFTIYLPTDVGPTKDAWVTATSYTPRDTVKVGTRIYEMRSPSVGTSGATPPPGTDLNNNVSDGTLAWRYLGEDNDLLKCQPGGYLLAVTVRTADRAHARTGLYFVIFDDYGTDYTTCMQVGTDQTKGASAPTALIVSVSNRGVFSVTATQAAAVAHECSYAWTKMQAL